MGTHDTQHGAYCLYPARLADSVDVTRLDDDGTTRYVVRNSATSRYFLLKTLEYRVFQQIDGRRTITDITAGGLDHPGPRVSPDALLRFLTKLDSVGILARSGRLADAKVEAPKRGLYIRFRLFNPDSLLGWLNRKLGWALSKPFITASFMLMTLAAFGMLGRAPEIAAYTSYAYSQYGLIAVIVVALTITALHEFAHGLACKHFGGEVREVGLLMIYYVLPGLYCNVSDIHRIGGKRQRLWVIFAGIYWQLLVSAVGASLWLIATPYTLLADLCFLAFLGGTFNILINCNPLIKLDGYYALSQLTGVNNLQSASSAYVRSALRRLLSPQPSLPTQHSPSSTQHSALYLTYWLASLIYSIGLIWLILTWLGNHLMDALGFLGVLLTVALAALLTEKWWKPALTRTGLAIASMPNALFRQAAALVKPETRTHEGVTNMTAQAATKQIDAETANPQSPTQQPSQARPAWLTRRRVVNWGLAGLVVAALVAPWEASTGSDCTLLLPPGHEGVARSNTDAVLSQIYVKPGDQVAEGARVARLTNPDIEDRLTQLNAEIQRLETNNSRIEDELRIRAEVLLSANLKESDRKRVADELRAEAVQIGSWRGDAETGRRGDAGTRGPRDGDALGHAEADKGAAFLRVSTSISSGPHVPASPRLPVSPSPSLPVSSSPRLPVAGSPSASLPAALAVLQSEIELKQTELEHNRVEVERYHRLLDQGLVGAQMYDRAVAAMRMSERELQGARSRLEAALVEHRRATNGAETTSLVAETEARAARSSFEALIADLRANRQQLESLRLRRDLLQREYDGMNVTAPQSGVILGDDLTKMIGRRYTRGEEILRIGELQSFLLRIDVSEREIAGVRLDSPVRFKLKTVPGRTFTGRVSKINAEAQLNPHGQRFYAVEVLVENADGLLRPGMTGFARVSFGRQSIGLILADKLWQTLRPELWLF